MKKIILSVTLIVSAVAAATASEQNSKICEREYKNEAVERTVCKIAGDHAPEVRDCLIRERQSTGKRDQNDTRVAEVERHAKCFIDSQSNKNTDKKGK